MEVNPAYGYGRRNANTRRNNPLQSSHDITLVQCYQGDSHGITPTEESSNVPEITTIVNQSTNDEQNDEEEHMYTVVVDDSEPETYITNLSRDGDEHHVYTTVDKSKTESITAEVVSECSKRGGEKRKERQGILILLIVILMATVLCSIPAILVLLAILLSQQNYNYNINYLYG